MAGEIDGLLIFGCLIFLQLFTWGSLRAIAQSWASSVMALEEDASNEPSEDLKVFGEIWSRPKPRIDYGAYHQKNRDAEALCIVGRSTLSETDFASLSCE